MRHKLHLFDFLSKKKEKMGTLTNEMRKLLWMIFLFGTYVWLMTSGRDRMVIEHGKNLYEALIAWFDDAEVDFQVSSQKTKEPKKRSRRWD